MKILAIGNSFSQNATEYVNKISDLLGTELSVFNLYIGGCSLQRHYDNINCHEPVYELQRNAQKICDISLQDAVEKETWDIITLQQVSGDSGVHDSFEPYLSALVSWLRELQPHIKIMWHETWSYDRNSDHPDFVNYSGKQEIMEQAIFAASQAVSEQYNLEIIPTGHMIAYSRRLSFFQNRSLCVDGYHLEPDYGRFIAGITLYSSFMKTLLPRDFLTVAKYFEIENSLANDILKGLLDVSTSRK